MDDEIYSLLLKKAGALLGRRPYSRGELRDKLVRFAGELPLEAVLDRLEQLKLLNDADYSYNFASWRMKHEGWGPAKVQNALLRRQVAPAVIESALERIRTELGPETALMNYLRKYCEKQGIPSDSKTLHKLFFHLRQRGFEEESISGALRQIIPAPLWQRFETGE